MKRKFILTIENYSRFNLDEYGESKITKEAHAVWHPMNSVLRQESINVLNIGHVYMQDEYFQLGSLSANNETVYRPTNEGFRPMEFDNNHQFGVAYEMSLDLITYERTVYGFLEWVSDLGGLASALIAFQAVILKMLMY